MNEQLFESRMGSLAVSPFLSDFLENSEEKKLFFFFEKHSADVCCINEFNYRYCMPSGACLIFGCYVNIISLWRSFFRFLHAGKQLF